MNRLLAKHISPGMNIGIVSVSAPEAAIESARFERGQRMLEKRGYRVHVAPTVFDRHGYLSAPERVLAADLNSAFQNSEIDAIICAGGGTNSNRLLRHIDFDAINAHPKIFMGMSNPSTILNAIHVRTGLITFHGPVLVWNFGEPGGLDPYTAMNLWPMLETTWPRREIKNESSWGWFRPGKATGPLLGGNLTSVEALLGTPYEPCWDGAVFFWEDIAKPVNRLDLMLTHFRDVGVFNRISAMIVGRLVACDEPEGGLSFSQMLDEVLEGTDFPVLLEVDLGHTAKKMTLPIGGQVELGSKNALLDDSLTLNADIFYYNYHGYQISEIVDRTAINLNFNAHVEGAELESTWEPLPGLRFNLAGGWEDTALAKGSQSVDLMDRTAGNPNWVVNKPFVTQASNCIIPAYVILAQLTQFTRNEAVNCGTAYGRDLDPVTNQPYVPNPTTDSLGNPIPAGSYPGFDPTTAPNNGAGFEKNIAGNQLPNAPPFTFSFGAQYTVPVSSSWAATLRGDFYWQDESWARVFNDNPYDRLHGYSNLNLALILNSDDGWQVMGYVKNVFDTTAITGDFLNSDDSGLTTNVFLTDPRLFGVRITKDFAAGSSGSYGVPDFFDGLFSDADHGTPSLWIELGGQMENMTAPGDAIDQPFLHQLARLGFTSPLQLQRDLSQGFGEEAAVSYQAPNSDWILTGSIRYGRSTTRKDLHQQTPGLTGQPVRYGTLVLGPLPSTFVNFQKFEDVHPVNRETHAIIDFTAGTDVGLGGLSSQGESIVNLGVRYVQFTSLQTLLLHADPDFTVPSNLKYLATHHTNTIKSKIERSFLGIGPEISWKGSLPLFGDLQTGEIDFDLGANGALLFGRQRAHGHHQTTLSYHKSSILFGNHVTSTALISAAVNRSKETLVPNVGLIAGLSVRYTNAKVSFGYRDDVFFHAIDGGIDTYHAIDRGFSGPFMKLSIRIGG